MWPDRVSSPGLLTYESGALPTTLRGQAERHAGISILPYVSIKELKRGID